MRRFFHIHPHRQLQLCPRLKRPLAVALAAVMAGVLVHGARPALAVPAASQPATKPADAEMIQLSLPKNLQVKTLVEYISQRMQMNILYDESLVKGTVTVNSPAKIPKDSLMDLFKGILKINGLVLVDADQPGWKRIVASKDLLLTTRQVDKTGQLIKQAEPMEVVSQVFEPKNVSAESLAKTIATFLTKPGGSTFQIPGRNMMIITDYAQNLRRVLDIIELIDQPEPKACIRFLPVKNRDAAKLAAEVTALMARKRSVASGLAKAEAAGVTLSAEPRTNQIVMVYVKGAEKEALDLIKLLDVPTDAQTRTYACQYVSPARLDKMAKDLGLTEGAEGLYKATVDTEGNVLIVTAPPEIQSKVAELKARLDVKPDTVTRTYACRFMAPQRLDQMMKNRLEHMPDKPLYKATADAEGQMLVVTASAEVHTHLAELKEQYDVKPETRTHTYRLEYISPGRIDKLAKDMIEHEEIKPLFKSTVEDDEGMLIVTGPELVHQRVEALIKEFDIPSLQGEASFVHFYKLMNTTASDVLATIRGLNIGEVASAEPGTGQGQGQGVSSLGGTREAFTGPNVYPASLGTELPKPPSYGEPTTRPVVGGTSNSGRSGGVERNALGVESERAKVTIDQNTNSIIVIAPPDIQRIYKQLIAMLDRRRPQVIIEATLVTLDTSNNFSLGVELSKAGNAGDARRYLTFSSFGLSTPDLDSGALTLKPGIGFNGVMVGADMLNVVIRALETSGKSKVLSAPKILVNDNATATLSSVSESPFTSVNASNTVATTSFAGYASAGTTVTFTPHISEGDHLQLKYSITLNSFTGEGSGSVPPPRQTNQISSDVTVPGGQAVIVGGLTREDLQHTVSSIPWLGKVPILEYLLGNRSDTHAQSTLFVFIRPMILRDDEFEDLRYYSDRELELAKLPPNYPASDPMMMD